jgi:RNA polymerase sigma-70 factor (ECF subfamily)
MGLGRLGVLVPASRIIDNSLIIDEPRLREPGLSAPDIAALTARMARGDEEAYRQFYALYFDRLLRYLLVVTGNEQSARDALQSTLLRVVRHARRFDSEPVFWSWLTVLARSSVADEGRRSSRYLGFLGRFFQHEQLAANAPPNDADERLMDLLEANLAALPAGERELLERKYLAGEPVRQIAEETLTTEKAVESRLVRVRRKLKEMILTQLEHGH